MTNLSNHDITIDDDNTVFPFSKQMMDFISQQCKMFGGVRADIYRVPSTPFQRLQARGIGPR